MQRFNLARFYYDTNDSTAATPAAKWLKKRFTYLMPSASTDSLSIPAGDGIGYGKVTANGQSKIMGWSNAGYRFTYSNRLQNGDELARSGTLPFYTQTSKTSNGSEWMAGTIKYDVPGRRSNLWQGSFAT